jgi:hypothetical protein
MSTPLVLAFIWIIVTNFIAILPSRDRHWTAAYILIAIGLPIGAWVFWQHGFWIWYRRFHRRGVDVALADPLCMALGEAKIAGRG